VVLWQIRTDKREKDKNEQRVVGKLERHREEGSVLQGSCLVTEFSAAPVPKRRGCSWFLESIV